MCLSYSTWRIPLCVSFVVMLGIAAHAMAAPDENTTPGDKAAAETEPQADAAADFQRNWHKPTYWQTVDGRATEDSWQFTDGEIRLLNPRGGKGSLLSPPLPAHFELSFEWKAGEDSNTGVKYRVRSFAGQWLGIEYQIMDEPIPLQAASAGSTAAIYDLQAPAIDKPLKPVGQWNNARIVAQGDTLEHYLNGTLVASTNIGGPAWQAKIVRSKFYGRESFGEAATADRIMLTDHGGQVSFREFKFVAVADPATTEAPLAEPQLGNGLRNSWADQSSIVLWTRTTQNADMVSDGPQFMTLPASDVSRLNKETDEDVLLGSQLPPGTKLEQILGAAPGAAGEVRLTYFPEKNRKPSLSTEWQTTHAESDFTAQWKLHNLQAGTRYVAIIEARPIGAQEITAVRRGGFQTAPPADEVVDVRFCMTTCHDFMRRDDGLRGHKIYPAMTSLAPDFVVHAGDIEYYDKPHPWAWTIDLMRFRWARIFSLPQNREFYTNTTSYFMKDDHDTLKNDCWAGQTYGAVSFEQGVQLFEEQFPARSPRYHTIAWGQDIQIWLLEGRDYRSPNTLPDGPDKTILGAAQKAWLFETLKESTATFKLVFSPTPVVGPDRDNKKDNHANTTFEHEGAELRQLFSQLENVIVFCGDRHWQYASVDDATGLWEFGCGPGSAEHELGWKEGDVRPVHRFLRVQGGFLSGQVSHAGPEMQPKLTLRHHTVTGEKLSEFTFPVER